MRSGIYVMIRQNKVRMFAPFVNEDFRNAWGPRLKLEGNLHVKESWAARTMAPRRAPGGRFFSSDFEHRRPRYG